MNHLGPESFHRQFAIAGSRLVLYFLHAARVNASLPFDPASAVGSQHCCGAHAARGQCGRVNLAVGRRARHHPEDDAPRVTSHDPRCADGLCVAGYTAHCYHEPCDAWSPNWDLRGAAEDVDLLFRIGRDLGNSRRWPEWQPTSEFKALRDRSGAARPWK